VAQKGDGTAADAVEAFPPAWPIAGKTGTAQVNKKADTSLFVGFGPAVGDPNVPAQYAISAVIPQGGFGGEAAAPLALSILKPLSENAVPIAQPSAPLTVAEGGGG
jgi:penicillin-binding protein 2